VDVTGGEQVDGQGVGRGQVAGCGLAQAAQAPAGQAKDHRFEVAAVLGEGVGQSVRQRMAADGVGVLQFLEPVAENVRGDARQVLSDRGSRR